MAWSCVKEGTISKSFWKAGMLDSRFDVDVVRWPHKASDKDLFLEEDASCQVVLTLIEQTVQTEE